jgi:hypothetical protein
MSTFKPCNRADVVSAYGAYGAAEEEPSMLTQGSSILEQYAPALKTLLFDEDPRTAYAKKESELNGYIASYKATTSSLSKSIFGKRITELRAELSGLSRQIADLKTAETTKQVGKVLGIALIGGGLVVALLVGNLFREKAITERYKRTHGD